MSQELGVNKVLCLLFTCGGTKSEHQKLFISCDNPDHMRSFIHAHTHTDSYTLTFAQHAIMKSYATYIVNDQMHDSLWDNVSSRFVDDSHVGVDEISYRLHLSLQLRIQGT